MKYTQLRFVLQHWWRLLRARTTCGRGPQHQAPAPPLTFPDLDGFGSAVYHQRATTGFLDSFFLKKLSSRPGRWQSRLSNLSTLPSQVPAATQSSAQLLPLPLDQSPLPEASIAPATPWLTHPKTNNPPSSDPAPALPFHCPFISTLPSYQLPTFDKAKSNAWFHIADANFGLRKVTDPTTKYYYVLSKLDSTTLRKLSMFLDRLRGADPYKTKSRQCHASSARSLWKLCNAFSDWWIFIDASSQT